MTHTSLGLHARKCNIDVRPWHHQALGTRRSDNAWEPFVWALAGLATLTASGGLPVVRAMTALWSVTAYTHRSVAGNDKTCSSSSWRVSGDTSALGTGRPVRSNPRPDMATGRPSETACLLARVDYCCSERTRYSARLHGDRGLS